MIHNVVFKVTHTCNLACRYCYARDEKSEVVARSILKAAIKAAVQLDADTVHFIWHGGEPLFAGVDFFSEALTLQQAAADGSGKRFQNSLQTNGTLVHRDFADFFKRNEFSVGVSLDGPLHLHNANRLLPGGAGSYQRALKGYHTLRDAGVRTGIVCVVDPVSPPDAETLLDWLEEIGGDSASLSPIFSKRAVHCGAYPAFLISFREAIARRQSPIRVRELIFPGTTPEVRERMGLMDACHPGWPCHETISTVDERGYIYFGCDRFLDGHLGRKENFILGHVESGGFRKALSSARFSELSALAAVQERICKASCDIYPTCDGGCAADWMLLPEKETMGRPDVLICRSARRMAIPQDPENRDLRDETQQCVEVKK